MPKITHFELPVEDVERSIKFYSAAFGWKFQKWGEENYWMISTGSDDEPGINGGLMKKMDPNQPPTNVMDVPNLDEAMAAVRAAGGEIVVDRMEVPTIGWLSYFKDPDGIIIGMMELMPHGE